MDCDILDVYGHHDWDESPAIETESKTVIELGYSCNGCSVSLIKCYKANAEGYMFENGYEKKCPYHSEHLYDSGTISIHDEIFVTKTEKCLSCNVKRKRRFYYDGKKQESD